MNAVTNHILGGWQFNGILTANSGGPIGVGIGRDIANIGARSVSQRPNLNGDPNIDNPTSDRWFDPSVFSEPAPYTFGNAGRNIIIGPGRQSWTLGLYKNRPTTRVRRRPGRSRASRGHRPTRQVARLS